jgi:hypothetical protein
MKPLNSATRSCWHLCRSIWASSTSLIENLRLPSTFPNHHRKHRVGRSSASSQHLMRPRLGPRFKRRNQKPKRFQKWLWIKIATFCQTPRYGTRSPLPEWRASSIRHCEDYRTRFHLFQQRQNPSPSLNSLLLNRCPVHPQGDSLPLQWFGRLSQLQPTRPLPLALGSP